MLIVHLDTWPEELLSLGFKPLDGAGGAVDKISRLDLKALFEGRGVRFTAWSYTIAPLSEAIIRKNQLTITNMFFLRLPLAKELRRFLV
ncbi:MAG: hypothetical protein H7318_05845 [Oligoflexus sp.]|nr:hypothetical protein [Oligoflexus sp.]